MYKKIVNPETGRKVNINNKLGKKILSNYINLLRGGKVHKTEVVPEFCDADKIIVKPEAKTCSKRNLVSIDIYDSDFLNGTIKFI